MMMSKTFPVNASHGVALLFLGIGLLCSNGCVSKKIEPADIPRISTSQNSEGVVTLSWASKKGYSYRLFILDMKTREWKPVEGADLFEGTGEIITVQDQQKPGKELPWYSVRPEITKN